MTDRIMNAAKALFVHNIGTMADPDALEAAWLLDEEIQQFWVGQVNVVVGALA